MKIISKFIVILIFMAGSIQGTVQAQEADEIMDLITERLDLSNNQAERMGFLLVGYRASMDNIFLKYEGEAEPDVGAMIGEIRDSRDAFRKNLQDLLSKDQYNTYLGMVDEILTQMFNDLAEIRLMDLQALIDLTDKQIESLTPVLGKSLLSTTYLLFENAETKLSSSKKTNIKNSLKKIEKEKRAEMDKILTPAQLATYDAYKEELKAARKGK
jgi:hypothetical protein